MCSSHRDNYFQFAILLWPLSVGTVLSVCHMSIKSLVMKISYLLPHAKLLPVTFFMNRSYLHSHENFKLSYFQNEARYDPAFPLHLDLVKSILCSKNYAISSAQTQGIVGPYFCRLIRSRPRREEGNCSYLLPSSHHGIKKLQTGYQHHLSPATAVA